jgi:hypothetical protein
MQPLFSRVLWAAAALWATGCADGFPAAPKESGFRVLPGGTSLPLSNGFIAPTRRLRRLSSREYDNVVHDLLGDTTQPAKSFRIVDTYQNGYDNGSAGLVVQSEQVVDYQSASETLAATAVQDKMSQLLGGCDPTAQGQQPCLDAFLGDFAARAYRRPLTDTERQNLSTVFQADAALGGFGRGLQTMLEVILQSPQFLYREELGPLDAAATPGTALRLTDHEVASELSFLLTGSSPDAELWTSVETGTFRTVGDYERETARLLSGSAARGVLRAFLHEWLSTDRLATLSKDASFYPTFDSALAASMNTELDQFFDSVLWAGTGSLRELFTSSQSFVDTNLGQLYGVPVLGSGFQPVGLDAQLRQGVLTRAGYLAVTSATDSSGPISRGVFLLRSLLCSPPPPPPGNVPPFPPANAPSVKTLTTRQRFDQHVSTPFCASCHKQIDGIGFGFEEFDGIGAYRATENGQPVDSSGTVIGTGEIDGDYNGAGELISRVSGSHLLADCYVRQAYRYAMGQIEGADEDLRALAGAFSPDAKMTDVLLRIVRDPLFVVRSFEKPGP